MFNVFSSYWSETICNAHMHTQWLFLFITFHSNYPNNMLWKNYFSLRWFTLQVVRLFQAITDLLTLKNNTPIDFSTFLLTLIIHRLQYQSQSHWYHLKSEIVQPWENASKITGILQQNCFGSLYCKDCIHAHYRDDLQKYVNVRICGRYSICIAGSL